MLVDYRGSVAPGKPHIGIRVIPGKQPGGEAMLRPGANTIPDAQWAEIKIHPSVAGMLESGEMRVLVGEKGAAFDVAKLSPSDALDLIARTTEPDTLERWSEQLEAAASGKPVWKNALDKIVAQIAAVTTDALGKPAKQRPLKMLPA